MLLPVNRLQVGKTHTYSQEQKGINGTNQESSFSVRSWWKAASLYSSKLHLLTNLHIKNVSANVFMDIFTVYPEDNTISINTLCGKNMQILNIKK